MEFSLKGKPIFIKYPFKEHYVLYKAYGLDPIAEITERFEYLSQTWIVTYHTPWTNGGWCIELEQVQTGVGLALLKAGQGQYAQYQRAPLIRWLPEDFRSFLDKNRMKIRKRDCTGVFSGCTVSKEELISTKHDPKLEIESKTEIF